MMKTLVATLVGAIILFVWQSLSWTVLPVHDNMARYSEAESLILDVMNENLNEDGVYYFPNVKPGASRSERMELMKDMEGKPAAMVFFYKTYQTEMVRQMIIGLVIMLVAVWVIVRMLQRGRVSYNTMRKRFTFVFSYFAFILLMSHMMMWNWWGAPWYYLSGEVIDVIVMGILLGVWLGWYMGRGQTDTSAVQ